MIRIKVVRAILTLDIKHDSHMQAVVSLLIANFRAVFLTLHFFLTSSFNFLFSFSLHYMTFLIFFLTASFDFFIVFFFTASFDFSFLALTASFDTKVSLLSYQL